MRRLTALFLLALILCAPALGGDGELRLILVISLDQFPQQYLERFQQHFTEGGFARLFQEGAVFTNATLKHAISVTGPGHAVLLTGCYGNRNGIVQNSWYDATRRATINCVADTSVMILGGQGEKRSPANLLTSTFGDQLRLHTGFQSRVVALSLKDRGAILMAGLLPSTVIWMGDTTFVTSTYYTPSLPDWVERFNASGVIRSYFGRVWEKILPEEAYRNLGPDDAPWEAVSEGTSRTFPHTWREPSHITPSYYDDLRSSPFGNELLASLARAAIEGEQLGRRGVTDLLCVSFSSTDYVGHPFGPDSHEMMDMVVRTDRMLAELLAFVDDRIGLDRCIIALSSDHGVAPIPEYLRFRMPAARAGRISGRSLLKAATDALSSRYGEPASGERWIDRTLGGSVHLNRRVLEQKKLDLDEAAHVVARALQSQPGVAVAATSAELAGAQSAGSIRERMQRSYYPGRSGDVLFVLKPFQYLSDGSTGAEHGTPYTYDTHVPLILMGPGLRPGRYAGEASPADLAPTLSALTGVEFPANREGRVLTEALR